MPERAPTTIAGCDHRAAGASGRTSGARSSRGSTTLLAALRACARIRRASLGLARRWPSGLALASFLLAALLLLPAGADARSEKTVGWTAAKVFPTAVRFLRVDEGVAIVEKDVDAGYVLFELKDEGKTYQGALELVTLDDDKVRIVIRIEDRPDYMEVGMLDRLERKLRDELGPPPPRPEKKKPEKKPEPEKDKPADAPAK